MVDPVVSGVGWLRRADAELARHPDLEHAAREVRGFEAGGRWMATAIATLRGRPLRSRTTAFTRLGTTKYAKCAAAAVGAFLATAPWGIACALAATVLAFYAVEARSVFVFPAAIEFGRRGPAAARALHRRAGGTITVMTRVLPIAAFMVFGWIVNGRPRHNFAVGCLAVVLWSESLRRRETSTPCVLELGATAPLHVVRVEHAVESNEDRGAEAPNTRVLYASDLHLGAWGAERALRELLRITIRERPDVVLLGGDLIDAPRALPRLRDWIRRLRTWSIVAAVPGNHDARWLDVLAAIVTEEGGHWLPHRPLRIAGLRIDGVPSRDASEASERRILCAHHPNVFETAAWLGYGIVFAGHLHGGQMIVCDVRGRHFPGAWFAPFTGRCFERAETTMLISRGLADTLPIRFRCPREVILLTLQNVEHTNSRVDATTVNSIHSPR
ncbi:MAG: metallophosphoesterase [Planctomycetes bacterium]|nr:metallophosphoesterase [Planctomycetota bacterium]